MPTVWIRGPLYRFVLGALSEAAPAALSRFEIIDRIRYEKPRGTPYRGDLGPTLARLKRAGMVVEIPGDGERRFRLR